MFNTRSGFWMLISIGLLSVLATCAVIIFAPDDEVTYESFATAIGFPMSVILPMIAISASPASEPPLGSRRSPWCRAAAA